MSGLWRKADSSPPVGRTAIGMPSDPMEQQLKKVEELLDRGLTLDEAKVDLAKLFVQEYGHESSRNLIRAGKDEVQSNVPSMITSAAAAAISGVNGFKKPIAFRAAPEPANLASSNPADLSQPKSSLYARAEKIADLHSCPDEDFRLQVSVTRRSLKMIFDAAKSLVNNEFEYNDLLMLIWYLSSENSSLEEVASVFELPDEAAVWQRLSDTSKQLLGLRKNAKMDLPSTEFEEDDIVECFTRRTGASHSLGALGVFSLDCLDGNIISVLSVCDHRHYFRHLSLYTNLENPADIVRNSPIFRRLTEDHPKRYAFYCPRDGYPALPQLVPGFQPDEMELFDEVRDFSLRHNQVVNYLRTSIREAMVRFPKLMSLETISPDIVTAAFMLHNFCIDTKDSSVNYAVDLDSFFSSLD